MKKKILSLLLALTMVFGVLLPVTAVPETAVTANAATCPIEGATGAGTEADPLIVDDMVELKKALAYNGTLYIVAKNFPTELISFGGTIELPYFEVVSKKVLTLKQNLEVKCLNGDTSSLFRVNDGADFTMIAENRQEIKYTYTVLELAGPNAKATLKGPLRFRTTTDDGSQSSYSLVAHQGNILLDGADYYDVGLNIQSASFKNSAAVLKNCTIKKVALSGTAFKLYPGSVGYFGDNKHDFYAAPDFAITGTVKEDLRVTCMAGFNEQSPALEGTGETLTAAEEKVILGMSKKYSFSTASNTAWAEKVVYTPTGTIQVVDSTNNLIYSKTDSDSGTFDKNVKLSLDIKDIIKTPGKYRIIEIIKLTRDGKDATKYVHIYPIEVVDFNKFLGQSPAMPAGKTSFNLGEIKKDSYPVTFYAHRLPQNMVDEGYESIAKLRVYTAENNIYVYGEKAYCDKGQKISYDLNNLPAGSYKLVETIELRDKNNKVVKSAENTFAIDWTPQQDIKEVNITADWQGYISAPVCTTKGVKITNYVWEESIRSGWATLDSSDFFKKGSGYRLTVTVAAESGYKLDDSYTVKIDGEPATLKDGKWQISKRITAYVNFVDIEHSNAPEAGTYPEFDGYDIVQGANTSVKLVEWYKCDKDGIKLSEPLTAEDMFEKDSYYLLEVSAVPARGYSFDKNAAFYINGDSVNCKTISGGLKGYKIYHVDDAEGKYELYLYDGNQTGSAKNIIIKDGQYIASNSSVPSLIKPVGGYAYYKDGVLTLYAYNNEKAHFVFEEGNLDVYLKGRNRIGAISNSEFLGEINGLKKRNGNLTIDAEAKASLVVASNPLDAYCNIFVNTLTFNGGKVISCLANGTYGAALWAEKLIVADGYKAYVGETDDFDASEEWNGIADIKNYKNVWLDKDVCRHNYVKYEKCEPTCKEEGCKETFEICEDCYLIVKKENGEILTGDEATEFFFDVVIPKGDHTYQFVEKHNPTCTSSGAQSNYWICTVCHNYFVTNAKTPISLYEFSKNIYLPKLSHKLTAVGANPATCTTDGNIAHYKCTRENCGMLFADSAATSAITDATVKAPGHTAGNWQVKVAAQVGKKGTEVKKCTVCNAELETRDIPALVASHTHTLDLVKKVPATCTANGTIEHYKCSGCAKLFSDAAGTKEITDATAKATGHSVKKIAAVKATCTVNGTVEHYKCEKCAKLFYDAAATKEIADVTAKAPGHSYEWVVTKPAQVGVEGEQAYTCKVCKDVKEKKPIAALEAEYMLGDVDFSKKVDATDARLALRAAVGLDKLSDTAKKAADVDKNNAVDATDARIILRVAVGLDKLN